MSQVAVEKESFLDTPLTAVLKLDWEKTLYMLLLAVAVLTRFWDVGARAMSHDESLHALYSWKLYAGEGYRHDPMMHGPFLFHANALIYFLFGDNDFTARVVPALFGVALVVVPYFLRRWLGQVGALVTSVLLLISPSMLYYSRYIRNDIYIAVWTSLLILALFKYLETHAHRWLYFGAAVLILSMCTKEVAYITGFIGATFIALAWVWERLNARQRQMVRLATVIAIVALSALGLALARSGPGTTGHKLVQYLVLVVGLLVAALATTGLWDGGGQPMSRALKKVTWQAVAISLGIMVLIYVLLFTTFFTNPAGLVTGIFGSVSYWLAQHGVQRGGQPWYYYFVVGGMYEFLPFLFSLIGLMYYLGRGPSQARNPEPVGESRRMHKAIPTPGADERDLFVPFLIYWLITTFLIYSWAGEKMPWLMVHPALPMIVFSGRLVGDVVSKVNWQEAWRRGAGWLMLLLPLVIFAVATLVQVTPFRGMSLSELNATAQWLAALIVTGALVYLLVRVVRRLGYRASLVTSFVTLLIFLGAFTVRAAWMAAYINYDYATEVLVYAHATPDIKLTINELAELSRRTVGDKLIRLAYDDDSTWPLEWYLREFPNKVYYGAQPNKDALDSPVVIVGSKNEAKVKPFLGNRYYKFKRRLIWWPDQNYMDMTWARLRDLIAKPEERANLWRIFMYRKYQKSTDDWYHVHYFYVYVRKDVANQVWDFGASPPQPVEVAEDIYLKNFRQIAAVQVWGSWGSGNGQFANPRNVALAPDGSLYVVDTNNHRIQKFDAAGNFVLAFGSQGAGPGQFQEPWGIAVDAAGTVYVADTWNHRIQKFDAEGKFLTAWGRYASTNGQLGEPGVFWGPRGIAIDHDGNLYITDTGNKRVQKFDPEGNFLGQWGGYGIEPGQFDEPVGIVIDEKGNIYIADTWNQRIQKFDANFNFLKAWPIIGWESESVVNKPYLAVDGRGRLYASDPENFRVLVFTTEGDFLYTFGVFGADATGFNLPTGLAAAADGTLFVADADNHRIMKFGPEK